jgi:protein phosphatase PTC7
MQHAFNYPLQLGPASTTLPSHARTVEIQVKEGDIVILASDGMTDNLWDEDILDEVLKFCRHDAGSVERDVFARMLSQALCSRAKRVSERRGKACPSNPGATQEDRLNNAGWPSGWANVFEGGTDQAPEVPFARRAREEGVKFVGGKCDGMYGPGF